jgi:hypothetical protein
MYAKELGALCCVTADAIDFACLHDSGLALHWRLLERSEGVMCQFVGESNMSSVKWKVRAGLGGEICAIRGIVDGSCCCEYRAGLHGTVQ